ncbi:hypothetical protein RF55_21017 [Lasius niger]|uniref:Uncharacterized protein n=1 Tax=Lasius niger TaxID=67767 RepID=A0A0J7JY32_LASNI|nr:hypothetical protein RF55_21017 [Lasius niger]
MAAGKEPQPSQPAMVTPTPVLIENPNDTLQNTQMQDLQRQLTAVLAKQSQPIVMAAGKEPQPSQPAIVTPTPVLIENPNDTLQNVSKF